MNTELRIKNKYLISLCDWLSILQLTGKDSRQRTLFVDICIPRINEIGKKRNEITDKFVAKDAEGKWIKKEIEGRTFWDIPENKLDEFNKEFDAVSEEEFVVEIDKGNKIVFSKIKDLVLNTTQLFGPGENDPIPIKQYKLRLASDYVKWCEALEKLKI